MRLIELDHNNVCPNLFAAASRNNVTSLVCPVSSDGHMSEGWGKAFRTFFDTNNTNNDDNRLSFHKEYKRLCSCGYLTEGSLRTVWLDNGRYYGIYMPIKKTFKRTSSIKYIRSGIKSLVTFMINHGIVSVIMPVVGCCSLKGKPDLKRETVLNAVRSAFKEAVTNKVYSRHNYADYKLYILNVTSPDEPIPESPLPFIAVNQHYVTYRTDNPSYFASPDVASINSDRIIREMRETGEWNDCLDSIPGLTAGTTARTTTGRVAMAPHPGPGSFLSNNAYVVPCWQRPPSGADF